MFAEQVYRQKPRLITPVLLGKGPNRSTAPLFLPALVVYFGESVSLGTHSKPFMIHITLAL